MKKLACIPLLLAVCLPAWASLEDDIHAANSAARCFNCPGPKRQFCDCSGPGNCTCDPGLCACKACLYEPAKAADTSEVRILCNADDVVSFDGLVTGQEGSDRLFLADAADGAYRVEVRGPVRRIIKRIFVRKGQRTTLNCQHRNSDVAATREVYYPMRLPPQAPPQPVFTGSVRGGRGGC